jgi:hypothetical protein
MPFTIERDQFGRPGHSPAQRQHRTVHVSPRFEILEPRCLMSGAHTRAAAFRSSPTLRRNSMAATVLLGSPHLPSPTPIKAGSATVVHSATQPIGGRSTDVTPESRKLADDITDNAIAKDADGDSYVIVRETDSAHHTLATAQDLPDVPYFGVIGTIGGGDPIDLYRLTLSAGTRGFQFELDSPQPLSTAPLQFWMFDGSGRVIGKWSSSPDSSGSPISLELDTQFSGSTLYLGISGANHNGPAAPTLWIDYQLWVQRFTAPVSPSAASEGISIPSPTSTSLFLGALVQPLTALSAAQSRGNASTPAPAASTPRDTGIDIRVGVGSLPTRSAEPSGGVMSDGDPPSAALYLSSATDREGVDRFLTTPPVSPKDSIEPLARNRREEALDSLVVHRGPGGFPLLGAEAVGNWRRIPTVPLGDAEPFTTERADLVAEDLPAGQNLLLAVGEISELADQQVDAFALPTRTSGWVWGTLSSGMSVVTLLTLNAVFSNPIAGYDVVPSRLDLETGRSRNPGADRGGRKSNDTCGRVRNRWR